MSYFLLSSAHEYLLNNFPGEQILEVKRVYKNIQNGTLETYFETSKNSIKIDIPARKFFEEYYSKRKMSIHFIYTVQNRKFVAKVLLSNNYIRSLDLILPVYANYVQCWSVPSINPKPEDYTKLNKIFHTYRWKTPLEQKMLISCKVGNPVYTDFERICNSLQVMDTNTKVFKTELIQAIQNLSTESMLGLIRKLHLINRAADSHALQKLILAGFYLWMCINHEFPENLYPILDKFVSDQKIIYPHGVLHLESKQDLTSTLSVVFTKISQEA